MAKAKIDRQFSIYTYKDGSQVMGALLSFDKDPTEVEWFTIKGIIESVMEAYYEEIIHIKINRVADGSGRKVFDVWAAPADLDDPDGDKEWYGSMDGKPTIYMGYRWDEYLSGWL